jgi:hypothetical protein
MEERRNLSPDHPYANRLSEFVDGELSWRERRRVAEHLRWCSACTTAVEELRQLAASAPSLRADVEPSADLWPGIAARLTRRPAADPAHRRRPAAGWLLPRLAPLGGIAVVLVLVALVAWIRHAAVAPVAGPRTQASVSAGATRAVVRKSPGPETPDEAEYDSRVASLEREARRRLTLDRRVIDVLEENLATLDVSIANYREALSAEPEDADLRARLANARLRKLRVLQQAVTLSSEANN